MKLEIEDIEVSRFINFLLVITFSIVLLNISDLLLGYPSWQITRLINVGYESNFPTWFSSFLIAIAAFLAYKCALIYNKKSAGRRVWQLLSLGLLGMSLDEVAMIHESAGEVMNKYLIKNDQITHSSWSVILGPIIILAMFLFILKNKKHLTFSGQAARFLIIGVCIYIAGAFVFESLLNILSHLPNATLLKEIENIIEESCEMFGIIFIIKGLFAHYKSVSAFNNLKI